MESGDVPPPTVGLALIARDEERTLPRLLESCLPARTDLPDLQREQTRRDHTICADPHNRVTSANVRGRNYPVAVTQTDGLGHVTYVVK
jgi:hypothetical protein